MISIIDYGMGNLRSVQKALELIDVEAIITDNTDIIDKSTGIILPGVGGFPDAMQCLSAKGLEYAIKKSVEKGTPLLGICLGMQLLFEKGEEVRECTGLGIMKGSIKSLNNSVKIPHMGWNSLKIVKENKLLEGIEENSFTYFVHSFYADVDDREIINASTFYGQDIPAVVSLGNVYGVQFHPEKSGSCGLQMLKNFIKIVK